MKLSKRIYKLAELVREGETVADIGTDHGYVPMLLIKEGKSPRVIMSDISEGSLAKARETFELSQLDADPADFRLGDGLETVDIAETDDLIIAGLGGHTIVDILSADMAKSKSFKRLILQPRKHSGALRYFLYTNGWDIREDLLSEEGKFQCEILVAEPGDVSEREPLYPMDDIRWKYPADMYKSSPELAASKIGWKIGSVNEQIQNLKSADDDKSELIAKLQEDIEYLRDLVTEIK